MPDPGDPQALNRYTYVLNQQPLRYADPSGHAYAIDADAQYWEGPDGQLLVHTIDSGVSRLVAEMNTGLTSARAPLLELRRGNGFPVIQIPPLNIPLETIKGVGAVAGDEGFRPEFRNAVEGYGRADYPTKQTGHFLTAVAVSGLYPDAADALKRKLITTHEMYTDAGLGLIHQVWHAAGADADTFASAAEHYNAGNFAALEADVGKLWSKREKGKGNSTADLRLSVAGYALGQAIRGGTVETNRDMAWWVVNHVAD